MSEANGHDRARPRPKLSSRGEARRREREARLAKALRANLRRRKADLDSRGGAEATPGVATAGQSSPKDKDR